jgi:hypothetical protein
MDLDLAVTENSRPPTIEEEYKGVAQKISGGNRKLKMDNAVRNGLQRVIEKVKKIPFLIPDGDQFYKARLMYMDGQAGWALEMAESLGFLKPVGTIGGCQGCFFDDAALFWIINAILKETENKKVVFLAAATVVIEEDWQLSPFSGERLIKAIYEFQRNPKTKVVIVPGSLPRHATMVSFRRNDGEINILWVDPNGNEQSGTLASNAIKKFLDSNGPKEFTYEIEYPTCIVGPQAMDGYKIPENKEPGGYCRAWASLLLLYTVATDGAHPDEVLRELGSMLEGNPAYMRNFIRVVTRNVAKFVQKRLTLSGDECLYAVVPCCSGESYCSPISDDVSVSFEGSTF